jgi:ankyrin repeat protein
LYDAAGDHGMLDREWELLAPEENVLARSEHEHDWERDWIDFARDGRGNTLLLDREAREVVVYGTDPPGHRRLGVDLCRWFNACVERLEGEVSRLGPNHTRDMALVMAVEDNSLEGARQALEAGASPDAKDMLSSAISLAAEKPQRRELLELLLERGANVSFPGWNPPIFRALRSCRQDRVDAAISAVELLLNHGVSVDAREEHYGKTLLMEAATYGTLEIARLLVQRGANIDARVVRGTGPNSEQSVGETALVIACGCVTRETPLSESCLSIAFYLLERGADPNLANERSGETALTSAIRCRRLELVEQLLHAGADPNHVNAKGKQPLDIATDTLTFNRRVPVDPRIVELLRERGAK